MKYLVTGISGFVGTHLKERLLQQGHELVGIDVVAPKDPSGFRFQKMSMMDRDALMTLISEAAPDRIIHLASASSVGLSWQEPVDCFVNNTNIFLGLVEAVRLKKQTCRILSVGSSEEYGIVATDDLPLREDKAPNPMNPYAVARVAQEQLSRVFARGYGLNIVCTRSFNHLGPGQTERFVMSSFVRQAVEVSLGRREGITCGDLEIIRDFIDVRDVLSAYELLLEKGVPGGLYNVCYGQGLSLRKLLEIICGKLGIAQKFTVLPELIRPIDNPVIVGDNTRLRELGFVPQYTLERSLNDMIAWWQKKIV